MSPKLSFLSYQSFLTGPYGHIGQQFSGKEPF
jgi:hypothetical protein